MEGVRVELKGRDGIAAELSAPCGMMRSSVVVARRHCCCCHSYAMLAAFWHLNLQSPIPIPWQTRSCLAAAAPEQQIAELLPQAIQQKLWQAAMLVDAWGCSCA